MEISDVSAEFFVSRVTERVYLLYISILLLSDKIIVIEYLPGVWARLGEKSSKS